MLKTLSILALLLAPLAVPAPALAEGSGIPTGPGCTLNPFDRTWRCIDFDHCTTKADGTKDCPVTTGTYLRADSVGSAATAPSHRPVRLPKTGTLN